jgi:hypothetical protein
MIYTVQRLTVYRILCTYLTDSPARSADLINRAGVGGHEVLRGGQGGEELVGVERRG